MAIMVTVVFALLIIGVPIGFSFALSGMIGGWLGGLPLGTITASPYQAVTSFPLLAIPFFLLAGQLMNQGQLIDRLVNLTELLFSWVAGRLGYVTIIASAFLGAMTGSSVATVAAVGASIGDRMISRGYKRGYVASLTAACGLLGVLIPPSIPLIVYGAAVGVSVSDLFLATVVPGVIMTASYLVVHRLMMGRVLDNSPEAKREKSSGKELSFQQSPKTILWKALPALFMPVIILGGIYSGIFTATEAAAVAGLYGLLVIIIGKMIKLSGIPDVFYMAVQPAIGILAIIAFASIFNKILILEQIPQAVAEFTVGLTTNPKVFLIFVNIILFFVGMFMETNAAVLLMAPLLYPAAQKFGINPIHFGIILVTNIEIGLITPPMAANLYVAAKTNKSSLVEMAPYFGWFLLDSLLVLMLITYVPSLSIWFK